MKIINEEQLDSKLDHLIDESTERAKLATANGLKEIAAYELGYQRALYEIMDVGGTLAYLPEQNSEA